jgi:hypothetical protein
MDRPKEALHRPLIFDLSLTTGHIILSRLTIRNSMGVFQLKIDDREHPVRSVASLLAPRSSP